MRRFFFCRKDAEKHSETAKRPLDAGLVIAAPAESRDWIDARFWDMYHSGIVPPMEECAMTKAGELLRAVGLIVFRFFGFGEMVGDDYDTEYVNPAARFIQEIYPGTELAGAVKAMWNVQWHDTYRSAAILLTRMVMDFLEENKNLMTEENEWDCLEFDGPEDCRCGEREEEDDGWGGISLREHDLAQYPPRDWRR